MTQAVYSPGGFFTAVASLTRPANTTAYAAHDAVLAATSGADALEIRSVSRFPLEAMRIERLRLRHRARKPVEDKPVRTRLRDRIADNSDHYIVGNQLAFGHHLLGLKTELRPCCHRCAQHITGGEFGEIEFIPQVIALRPFTSTRRPEENDIHTILRIARDYFRPLRRAFLISASY